MSLKISDLKFTLTGTDGKPFKFRSADDFPQLTKIFVDVLNNNQALVIVDAARRFHQAIQKGFSGTSRAATSLVTPAGRGRGTFAAAAAA